MAIPKYYIYHKDWVPFPVSNKHKWPARYGDFNLYVESLEIITGVPAENIEDLSLAGLNHPFVADEPGVTGPQLDDLIMGYMHPSAVQIGAEGHIQKLQAHYLYKTRFKPIESED